MTITYATRFDVDDRELSALHGRAFGTDPAVVRGWTERLRRHALSWIGAFHGGRLVGFVHLAWDGGAHAFLLDPVVEPDRQGEGIGAALVRAAADAARTAGCDWLHVDFEPHLTAFYLDRCGFRRTDAGLLRL
jgi:GNAT superfamily N-acetyltransferase